MDVHVVSGQAAAPAQTGPLQAQPAVSGTSQEDAAAQKQSDPAGPLAPVVARLVGGGDSAQSGSVNVSYRVEHNPNMVVMVMTDPNTGAEIAQVPAEVMVQMAQFFDKEQGVALDRSA
jgi:uncharacterized FlaG/YvyC family protein